MASMSIDTLALSLDLKAAEFSAPRAEALATAIGKASSDSLSTTATKADIANLETKIEAMQSKLIMYLFSTQLGVVALVVALLKL